MKIEKSDPELETVMSRIRGRELDLQPDFQRGEVWDTKRQQRLVDTVLRGWYVPAVHIVRSDEGEEEVLDGQQRLVAIRDFFDDKVRIDGNIEPHDLKIAALHGLKYSQLPDSTRKAVHRFVLQTITLTDYAPDEPNELFFRLNQAYNLTPPEKRNALRGDARDQVKSLVGDLTTEGLLDRARIGFGNNRLAYDDIIARACVTIQNRTLRSHINNNVVEDFYRAVEGFDEATIESLGRAGQRLLSLIDFAMERGQRIRLNKGTLQTWLVYCTWAPALFGELPREFISRFEEDRISLRAGEYESSTPTRRAAAQILRLYDDRASYRVTDVSSVLIRDLSLQLYAQAEFEWHSHLGTKGLLASILDDPEQAPALVNAYLDSSDWGILDSALGSA
jgi:hypothetical protein